MNSETVAFVILAISVLIVSLSSIQAFNFLLNRINDLEEKVALLTKRKT
jgi:hypothetical protein